MKGRKRLTPRKSYQNSRQLLLALLLGFLAVLWVGQLQPRSLVGALGSQPVSAQSLRPEDVAVIVYQRLPYLPKENKYIRLETGSVAEDHTLVSRLVRYHQDVEKRPTRFRLDWKLTLADYLGVNEPMKPERYPGSTTLTANPIESDRQAIQKLNRRQREELVDILVSLYRPQQADTQPTPPKPTPAPSSADTPKRPTLTKPGDAQLLLMP
jgi:hypothetical protein